MSVTIANLVRGPAYITVGSSTSPSTTTNTIQVGDDLEVDYVKETDNLVASVQGVVDETIRNRYVRIRSSGGPLVYPIASGNSTLFGWMWPWANAVPSPGASLFTNSQPIIVLSNNGDEVIVYNCAVVKPPPLTLEISRSAVGAFEAIALIRNTFDPESANSFYKKQTGQSYSAPVLLQTNDLIGRQRYLANWAIGNTMTGNNTFTNFQAEKGITVDFETSGAFISSQGQQVEWSLSSFRAMVRMIPIGPTASDIDTCLNFQGTSTAKQGSRLTALGSGDLIITGQFGLTATIKNAVLKSYGEKFGAITLRYGEIGFVGTFNLTASPYTGGLLLS